MAERLTSAGIEQLHLAAERHIGDARVPGLVALVCAGEQLHVEALGHLDLDGRPVERDSLFRLSSMTKPITAAATLAVIEEGLVGLHEPVERLLPELAERRVLRRMDGPLEDTVAAERAITTRDLLTFTFGFGMVMEMFMSPTPWPVVAADTLCAWPRSGRRTPTSEAIRTRGSQASARSPCWPSQARAGCTTPAPRCWACCSRGRPANRSRTCCARASSSRWACATPASGRRTPSAWQPPINRRQRASSCTTGPTARGAVRRRSPTAAPACCPTSRTCSRSRGCCATADPRCSRAESTRAMCSDQLTDAQKAHGGLGPDFFAGRSWGYCQAVSDGGAFGWDGGFGSSLLVDPGRDLIVIVLTQRLFETSTPPQVHRDIQGAAYAALA